MTYPFVGPVEVPAPSSGSHPTTKTYVDAELADKADTVHAHAGADITSGTVNIARIPTGTTGSTVPFGNDSRFSDARTPTSHVHAGADITSGTVPIAAIPTGTTGSTVPFGNDARFSDARTPTSHVHSGADITSGTVPIAQIPTGTSGTTVALGNHVHAAADVTSGTFAIGRIPTGTSGTTVALGNHDHASVYAALSHAHAGADITSGTVAYARLPVGATTSTVAAGDDSRFGAANVPPGPSPASVLNIGTRDGQTHFGLQMARDGDPSATIKTQAEIAAGFEESPYFVTNAAKTVVSMRASVNGPVVGSSSYARSELREAGLTGADFLFNAVDSGTHRMHGRTKITHLMAVLPEVVVAQLHNGTTDRVAIRTQLVSGTIRLRIRVNGSTATLDAGGTDLYNPYVPGTEFEWMIEVVNGSLKVYINDMVTAKVTSAALVTTGSSSWYFKAGVYLQSQNGVDGDSPTDYGSVELRDLWNWHTGWPTVATFYATPRHAATHATGAYDALAPADIGAAATSHVHAAADTTSGTFAIARIPTGTSSSTVAIGNDTRLSVKPYPPVTLTDQATVTTDASLGNHFRLTGSTSGRSIAAPTNPTDGQVITYEIKSSSGALTHNWNAVFSYGSDVTALTAIASGKTDFIQWVYTSAATKWNLIGYIKGFTT